MSEAQHRPPTLQERVTARFDSLTATERKVATYLSQQPQQAAFSSADAIASATGTSDASVVRTVKALGFDGLPGMKRMLQEHLGTLLTPAHLLSNTMSEFEDGPEGVLAGMLNERAALLEELRHSLDPAEFRRAVELVTGAHETLVCGIGGDLSLVEYTVARLNRIGRRARGASEGLQLVDRLLPLGADDVVVLIGHNPIRPEIHLTLDHAVEVGARVVLLTNDLGEALRDRIAAVLSAPNGRPDMYGGQSMMLIVLEALTMAVAAEDQDGAMAAFERRKELRGVFNELAATAGPATNGRTRRRRHK